MADIDAALVQQVLDVAQRERETHVHHDRKADDLGAGSEIAKRIGFAHPGRLWRSLLECKLHRLDTTTAGYLTDRTAPGAPCHRLDWRLVIPPERMVYRHQLRP